MRISISLAIFLMSLSCFSQDNKAKEDALLEIASLKNHVNQAATIEEYIDKNYFKDYSDYYAFAENRFNTHYQKKDTLNTLRTFNLLANRWIRGGKMDSVLTMKPIKPLLSPNIPVGIHAETQVMLYGYMKSIEANTKETLLKYRDVLKKYEKLQDSSYSSWATIHGDLLINATEANDFSSIMEHAFAAMALLRYQKDMEGLTDIEGLLATVYSLNFLFEPAKVLRNEVLNNALDNKNYQALIIENLNAALDEKLQENFEAEQNYLENAVKYADLMGVDHFKFITYHAYLVHACQQNKSEKTAAYYRLMTNSYPKFEGSVFHEMLYLEAQAYYQNSLRNFKAAEQFALAKLNLAESFNSKEILQETHQLLLLIYKASSQQGKAIEQENEVLTYLNKTKEEALKNQIVYYQTIFETEKRDLKIQAQESDIALLNEREKIRTQWYIIGAVIVLFIFGLLWSVRSRNFARNKQRLQESFTKDILKTQENERARIASELHDSIGQKLLILKNSLIGNKNKADKEIDLVGETIKEVREMSHSLHPFQFEKLGLVRSLKNMVETFQKNSNVFYSENIEVSDDRIDKEKAIYIFRMLQEAFTNVEKHAEATACNLSASEEKKQIVFTLKDNGKGFVLNHDLAELKGLGMRTLEERARFIQAEVSVDSILKKGTTITIKIPKE